MFSRTKQQSQKRGKADKIYWIGNPISPVITRSNSIQPEIWSSLVECLFAVLVLCLLLCPSNRAVQTLTYVAFVETHVAGNILHCGGSGLDNNAPGPADHSHYFVSFRNIPTKCLYGVLSKVTAVLTSSLIIRSVHSIQYYVHVADEFTSLTL